MTHAVARAASHLGRRPADLLLNVGLDSIDRAHEDGQPPGRALHRDLAVAQPQPLQQRRHRLPAQHRKPPSTSFNASRAQHAHWYEVRRCLGVVRVSLPSS